MKQVFVVKVKNDVNGNPQYIIDLSYYPDCKDLGKKVRNKGWLRKFSSYNLEETLKKYIDGEFEVCIISL